MKRTIDLFQGAALSLALFSASSAVQAADVSSYRVAKVHRYEQSSTAAPTESATPYLFYANVTGKVFEIDSASVDSAFGPQELSLVGDRFEFEFPMPSLQLLNSVFPDGNFPVTIDSANDGLSFAQLSLSGSSLPTTIPHVSNYTAAQSINAAANFTLTFDPFTGAAANDYYELQVVDSDENTAFSSSGTASSVVIPANTLQPDASYTGRLRFVKQADLDTTSIDGATGTAVYYNETVFDLGTGTGSGTTGGGGADTIPPTLVTASPTSGSTGVVAQSPVIFIFNEPMANSQSIQWSANVNASSLSYTWFDNKTLAVTASAGFPGNATVTWTLNPTPGAAGGFRDLAGNALQTVQGSFSTGAGGSTGGSTGGTTGGSTGGTTSGDPCNPGNVNRDAGFASIFKSLQFTQTATTAPVPDTRDAAMVGASFSAATNQTVSRVTITGPGVNQTLSNLFGTFFATESFSSGAALEAAFPAGNYTVTASGAGTAQIAVGSTASVPVPQFLNLTELASMDVTKPFTLRFAPFTGAGQFDGISLSIQADGNAGEFHAPDYCLKIELTNKATSIVIPANTFQAGHKYSGEISFTKSTFDTNSIPNTYVSSGLMVQTKFDLTSGGPGPGTIPIWKGVIVRNPDGTLSFGVQADTGASLAIESSDDLKNWTQFSVVTALNGNADVKLDPKTASRRFIRARLL